MKLKIQFMFKLNFLQKTGLNLRKSSSYNQRIENFKAETNDHEISGHVLLLLKNQLSNTNISQEEGIK